MGGGRAMTTAAKVAGLGIGKGGFRGGFPPATEQLRVKSAAAASASKPVSASIASVANPSVEEDAMIMQRPVWDDWEFAGVEEEPLPRVVFSKPPTLQEAKEATEDLKEAIDMVYMSTQKSSSAMEEGSNDEGGSVSKMLSSFQSSENRAIESAVPQVALQAFAFLSENSAAQTVVASIACDPKVWDAVMENKDLMKFLETNNNTVGSCNEDDSEHSSMTESEVCEEKPKELFEILQDIKLKAVRMMENISSYFGGLFGLGSVTEDGKDKKQTFFNDPRSLFGLAVMVIFMVVLKRA